MTVLLTLVTTPPDVGVRGIVTVAPLAILITELTVALIVVVAVSVAADATIGKLNTSTPDTILIPTAFTVFTLTVHVLPLCYTMLVAIVA